MEATPCRICREPTPMRATELCNRCWELTTRIESSPAIAARVMRDLGFTVTRADICPPAPAKRSARKERPAGWSDGAWEHYRAAQRAKTYASLAPDKIAASAMTALDKSEPVPPNPTFRAFLYAGEHAPRWATLRDDSGRANRDINEASIQLAKISAPGQVRLETPAEYANYTLRRDAAEAEVRASVVPTAITGRIDPYLSRLYDARGVAERLLSAGLRAEARELLRVVRQSERELRANYGSLQQSTPVSALHPITREQHRAMRAAKRAEAREAEA